MRVYAAMDPRLPMEQVCVHARRVEALGFDGLHVAETVHDGFIASALALEHTKRIIVRTAVTVAFARSPMVVAYAAWGLAGMSGGRFQLGLGTQVRGNLEGRFSVAWADPEARMREYLGSLGAIFSSFGSGGPLRYEGDHYRFTRLQPAFNPGPHGHPEIRIYLGGVGERMCRLAGEAADGLITHPTNSHPAYLAEIVLPALRAGAEATGRRDANSPELVVSGPVATGATTEDVAAAREHQRRALAFVYSTPSYAPTLERCGFTEAGARLHELSRAGRWDEMPAVVTDEMLDVLVPSATYPELPELLGKRLGALASAIVLHPPEDPRDDAAFAEVVGALRAR